MKKLIILFIVMIGLISCENNFSPKSDFYERYSFSCIVRADTVFQNAFVSHSYDVEDYNPQSNRNDPSIKNSIFRLWNNSDEIYFFRDTTKSRIDQNRYATDVNFYHADSLEIKPNDYLEVDVLLPNGVRLTSETRVPKEVEFDFTNSTLEVNDTTTFVRVAWQKTDETTVYLPKLNLYYQHLIDGEWVRKIKSVPVQFANSGGSSEEVYAKPSSNNIYLSDISVLEKILTDISTDEPVKSNIKILSTILDLLVFDDHLSNYYASTVKNNDSFSVSLDEYDYTNVNNGYGIFASYLKQVKPILFNKAYIEAFGYQFAGN